MFPLRLLLVSLMLMMFNKNAEAALHSSLDNSISISITMNSNSIVNLTRNQDGQYSGNLILSAKEINNGRIYTIAQPISSDTVKNLIQRVLNLGLLEIQGSDAKVIDGFRSSFVIKQLNEERIVRLVAGLPNNENSSRAGDIILLLSSELNVKNRLHEFLNTAPPGVYSMGMTTVKVHEILSAGVKKSSLYQSFEKSFKRNRINVPLYIINGVIVPPIELNKYQLEDVKDVKVKTSSEATALYGASAANGVVILEIKGN